jgi:hypothetical protein
MTKAQRKTLETAIARLEKLRSDLNDTREIGPIQDAIAKLREAEAVLRPKEDGQA